jgi:hypothetical protein
MPFEMSNLDFEPLPFHSNEDNTPFDLGDFDQQPKDKEKNVVVTQVATVSTSASAPPSLNVQASVPDGQDLWDLGAESPRAPSSHRFGYLTATFKN